MPIGALMMKQFIVFNLEAPLSPDPVSIGPNNCCWIWGQVAG